MRRRITVPKLGIDQSNGKAYDFLWVKNSTPEGYILPTGWEGTVEATYRLPLQFPVVTRWFVLPWNFHLSRRSPSFRTGVSPIRLTMTDGIRELNVRAAKRRIALGPLIMGRDVRLALNFKLDWRPDVGYVELLEDGEVVVPKTFMATQYHNEKEVVLWEGCYKPGILNKSHPNSNDELVEFELTDAIVTPLGLPALDGTFKGVTKSTTASVAVVVPPAPLELTLRGTDAEVGQESVFVATVSRDAYISLDFGAQSSAPVRSFMAAQRWSVPGTYAVVARAMAADEARAEACTTVEVSLPRLEGDGSYLIPDPPAFRETLTHDQRRAADLIVGKASTALVIGPVINLSNAQVRRPALPAYYTQGNVDFGRALNLGLAWQITQDERYRDHARKYLEHWAKIYKPLGGHGYPQIAHHVDEGVPINAAASAFDLVRNPDWRGMGAVQEWFTYFVSRAKQLVRGNWLHGNAYPEKGSKGSMFANGVSWAMSQGFKSALAADDLESARWFAITEDNMDEESPYLAGHTYNMRYMIENAIEPSGRVHDELWRRNTDYGQFFLMGMLDCAHMGLSLGFDLFAVADERLRAAGRWYAGYNSGAVPLPSGYTGGKREKYAAAVGEQLLRAYPNDEQLTLGVAWGDRAAHYGGPFPSHQAVLTRYRVSV